MPDSNREYPPSGEGEPRPYGEFEGRTCLYIRTHPHDDGSEPLRTGVRHWKSPDIVIIQPSGTRSGEAIAGRENQVEVAVTNGGGIDAVDAYVDAFFADPSTGFTPATATPIAGGFLTIPGYSRRQIHLPWTPSASDAGHRCILARVALFPLDTYADGTVFDVKGDRHVAQRNIHVVSMAKEAKMIHFAFGITNTENEVMEVTIRPREIRDPKQWATLSRAVGCEFIQFGETRLREYKVDLGDDRVVVPREVIEQFVRPTGSLRTAEVSIPLTEFRLQNLGVRSDVILNDPRDALKVRLEPLEVRQGLLMVTRPTETRPGDVHAVDIEQTGPGSEILGGLTVIVRH